MHNQGIILFTLTFVALPIVLLVLSRRVTNRLFRRLSLISFALWMLGLIAFLLISFDCTGNFLYGYDGCQGLSNTAADFLVPRALLAMAAAIVLYTMALLWLGWQKLRDRKRRADSPYSGPK